MNERVIWWSLFKNTTYKFNGKDENIYKHHCFDKMCAFGCETKTMVNGFRDLFYAVENEFYIRVHEWNNKFKVCCQRTSSPKLSKYTHWSGAGCLMLFRLWYSKHCLTQQSVAHYITFCIINSAAVRNLDPKTTLHRR